LNNDVKPIIAKHLLIKYKHYDFQKLLFGDIVFDEEHNKIKKKPDRISDDVDFNICKIYNISNVLNDIFYIGVTYHTLKNVFI
jgi:hypothetical protein